MKPHMHKHDMEDHAFAEVQAYVMYNAAGTQVSLQECRVHKIA